MLGSSAGGPEIWLSISAQPRTMSGFFQEFPVPALLSHFSLSLAPEMQCNCTHRSCQRLLELKLQIVLGFSLPQSLSSFESADTSFLWTSLIPQFFPPLFLWSLLRLLGRFPPRPTVSLLNVIISQSSSSALLYLSLHIPLGSHITPHDSKNHLNDDDFQIHILYLEISPNLRPRFPTL